MSRFNYQYAMVSHKGKVRMENEDYYWINGETAREGYLLRGKTDEFLRVAVADGMGGMSNGKLASSITVECINNQDPLDKCVINAGNAIYKNAREKRIKMGSTAALLEFNSNTITICNVGDTRIYRYRDHNLEQLSEDHTTIQFLLKSGLITPAEAINHPYRHQLTQYLGIDPDEIQIEPYMNDLEIMENDRYLVCSDGLTDMVSDKEIAETLDQKDDCKEAVEQLLQTALDNGGVDNITIGIIDIRKSSI